MSEFAAAPRPHAPVNHVAVPVLLLLGSGFSALVYQMMLQWIGHRAESQDKLIARTFLDVFPNTTVWADRTLLAGTKAALRLSESSFQNWLADPVHGKALASADVAGYADLLRLYTAGPEELRAFIGDGPVLTEDRPLVEFFSRGLPTTATSRRRDREEM
jgi:spermidine synthase